MLRISTTTLEAYRRCVETAYGDPRELADAIRGRPREPSWQMEAGSAWHDCLRRPVETGHITFHAGTPCQSHRSGQYVFSGDAVAAARRLLGHGLWEVKAAKVYDIGGQPVTVVAQADHVRGLLLTDTKTKFGPPDPRAYEPSLQWRFYLDVHAAACFRYCLCAFAEPDGGVCEFKDIVVFRLWPYAGLGDDCRRWLGEFLDWASDQGLTRFLDRLPDVPDAPRTGTVPQEQSREFAAACTRHGADPRLVLREHHVREFSQIPASLLTGILKDVRAGRYSKSETPEAGALRQGQLDPEKVAYLEGLYAELGGSAAELQAELKKRYGAASVKFLTAAEADSFAADLEADLEAMRQTAADGAAVVK